MKGLVEKKRPQSKDQLLKAILSSWEQITLQDIRNCINDLPKKIEKIIDCKGELL